MHTVLFKLAYRMYVASYLGCHALHAAWPTGGAYTYILPPTWLRSSKRHALLWQYRVAHA